MIITAKLAERVRQGFRQGFCACLTRESLAGRRLPRAYLSIMALEIVYLLGLFLPIALPDADCLHDALLRDVFLDTAFSHNAFHKTLRRSFNEPNYYPHYRRGPFRHLCHHHCVAAKEHGSQA